MKKLIFLSLSFVLTLATSSAFAKLTYAKATDYFVTPSSPTSAGHEPILKSIREARSSVRMWMFNMTTQESADALVAAHKRGVKVQVILNAGMFLKPSRVIDTLKANGVEFYKSSDAFSITHAKTTLIDNSYAWITTMNLTKLFDLTRDDGVKISDRDVIADLNELFDADLANAADQGARTPDHDSALVVSPTSAVPRLLELIDSAQKEILLTVENLSYTDLVDHLAKAAQRGVVVKAIAPLCDQTTDPFFNFPAMQTLQAAGVQARLMPFPASVTTPYMHQKMIVVDGRYAFVGSQNFSFNSLTKAREIGVLAEISAISNRLLNDFNHDWNATVEIPQGKLDKCVPYDFPPKK